MRDDRLLMPKIKDILDDIVGTTVFGKLEIFAGYWQVQLTVRMQQMTLLICNYCSFQLFVISFGLMNAPAMFQRMGSELFGHLYFVKLYIEEVMIHSNSIT